MPYASDGHDRTWNCMLVAKGEILFESDGDMSDLIANRPCRESTHLEEM
jgi:hypothetical protein